MPNPDKTPESGSSHGNLPLPFEEIIRRAITIPAHKPSIPKTKKKSAPKEKDS